MSTFSGLSTAYSGLNAARVGLDVTGQNISNAGTAGYTRQRVETSSVGAVSTVGGISGVASAQVGQGVSLDAIARLGSAQLDARVRLAAASDGYASYRSTALGTLETSLHEPNSGLSTQLSSMWSAWGDVANAPGDSAASSALLAKANAVVDTIRTGYQSVTAQWSSARADAGGMVDQVNSAAAQVADLNNRIRVTVAGGGNANELIDKRATLTQTLANLTGATTRDNADGTVDVTLSGDTLVQGGTTRTLQLVGATALTDAASSPLHLEFSQRPGSPVALSSGQIAGALSVLAPSSAGGPLAAAADSYNTIATQLAAAVNSVHSAGATPSGATGQNFFQIAAGQPAATGLSVLPTSAAGIAAGAVGAGAKDSSVATALAKLGTGPSSVDTKWSDVVVQIGSASSAATTAATLASTASTAAVKDQASQASVDLDEENVNLIHYQTAYQAAARVITTIDQMLDTLINRTGMVGR